MTTKCSDRAVPESVGARLRRFVGRLALGRRGGAAVEFALVMPIFVTIAGGIVETSLVYYAKATVTQYVREAARGVALGYMTTTEASTYLSTEFSSRFSFSVATSVTVTTPPGQMVTVTATLDSGDIATYTPFGVFTPSSIVEDVTMTVIKLKT